MTYTDILTRRELEEAISDLKKDLAKKMDEELARLDLKINHLDEVQLNQFRIYRQELINNQKHKKEVKNGKPNADR